MAVWWVDTLGVPMAAMKGKSRADLMVVSKDVQKAVAMAEQKDVN